MHSLMTKTVLLLIGLPGSGKSSLARWLCESTELPSAAVHIEYDIVAESLNEDNGLEAWRKSRLVALDKLTKQLQESPDSSLIIMDDNFHLRSMRKAVYRLCQEHSNLLGETPLLFGIIFVDTSLDVCLARNSERKFGSRVATEVIEKMARTLEPPDSTKTAWDSSFIRVCGENIDFSAITSWLESLSEKPVPPLPQEVDSEELERERQATQQSMLQKYDQLMRKWVGLVARIDRRNTENANKVRKTLLRDLHFRDSVSAEVIANDFCAQVCAKWDKAESDVLLTAILESAKLYL